MQKCKQVSALLLGGICSLHNVCDEMHKTKQMYQNCLSHEKESKVGPVVEYLHCMVHLCTFHVHVDGTYSYNLDVVSSYW